MHKHGVKNKHDKKYALDLHLNAGGSSTVKHQMFEKTGDLIKTVNNDRTPNTGGMDKNITNYGEWVYFCELIHKNINDFHIVSSEMIVLTPNIKFKSNADKEKSAVIGILFHLRALIQEYYGLIIPMFMAITLTIKKTKNRFDEVKINYYPIKVNANGNGVEITDANKDDLPDSRWTLNEYTPLPLFSYAGIPAACPAY